MLDLNKTPYWFALYTKSRAEKRVHEELQRKGFDSYLPVIKSVRQWHDRMKKVEMPLFPGYVFVRIALRDRISVLQIQGVVCFVALTSQPSPIPDYEITGIQRILNGEREFHQLNELPVGTHVKVIYGPFEGLQGTLVEYRGQDRFVLSIKQIRQALSVEIDRNEVVELTKHYKAPHIAA